MPDNSLKLIFDITNENEGSPIVDVTRQKGKGLLGLSLRLTKSPSSVKKEGDDFTVRGEDMKVETFDKTIWVDAEQSGKIQ